MVVRTIDPFLCDVISLCAIYMYMYMYMYCIRFIRHHKKIILLKRRQVESVGGGGEVGQASSARAGNCIPWPHVNENTELCN